MTGLLALWPWPVAAQSLRVPSTLFLASAAADWTATAYVETAPTNTTGTRTIGEQNPLLRPIQQHWGTPAMIAIGSAGDVAGLWAWNRYVGRKHPKLAAVGLYAASGFRIYLASRNVYWGRELRR